VDLYVPRLGEYADQHDGPYRPGPGRDR
jgi:hypothetical protein